jgi:hypothetical protein
MTRKNIVVHESVSSPQIREQQLMVVQQHAPYTYDKTNTLSKQQYDSIILSPTLRSNAWKDKKHHQHYKK